MAKSSVNMLHRFGMAMAFVAVLVVQVQYTTSKSTEFTEVAKANMSDEDIFILHHTGQSQGRHQGQPQNQNQDSKNGRNGPNNYGHCPTSQHIAVNSILPNYCISNDWIVASSQEGAGKNIYVIKDFSRVPGSGIFDYFQPRKYDKTIETLVIIPIFLAKDDGLGLLLESWKHTQNSVHYIVTKDVAFRWVHPLFANAQPPVGADLHGGSISILVTIESHDSTISYTQVKLIKHLLQLFTPTHIFNINLKYLVSVGHLRDGISHKGAGISNLEQVKHELCLRNYQGGGGESHHNVNDGYHAIKAHADNAESSPIHDGGVHSDADHDDGANPASGSQSSHN